jgi:hypothetical protein
MGANSKAFLGRQNNIQEQYVSLGIDLTIPCVAHYIDI